MSDLDLESLMGSSPASEVFRRVAKLRTAGAFQTDLELTLEVVRGLLKLGLPHESEETREAVAPRIATAILEEPRLAERIEYLITVESK